MAKLVTRRLHQMNRRLRSREADSYSRIADTLLVLAEDQGKRGHRGVEIPNLPHRELSCLSGMARQTVTHVLGRLEREGFIQRDQDSLYILDIDALEKTLV